MTNNDKINNVLENINSLFYLKLIEETKNKFIEKSEN